MPNPIGKFSKMSHRLFALGNGLKFCLQHLLIMIFNSDKQNLPSLKNKNLLSYLPTNELKRQYSKALIYWFYSQWQKSWRYGRRIWANFRNWKLFFLQKKCVLQLNVRQAYPICQPISERPQLCNHLSEDQGNLY